MSSDAIAVATVVEALQAYARVGRAGVTQLQLQALLTLIKFIAGTGKLPDCIAWPLLRRVVAESFMEVRDVGDCTFPQATPPRSR